VLGRLVVPMNIAIQLSGILALLVFVAGCVLLHVRLRCYSSLSLLFSIAALVIWYFWGTDAVTLAASKSPMLLGLSGGFGSLGAFAYAYLGSFLLLLWLSTSFLLSVMNVRPNSRPAA
jgi:hypothetical protein